MISDSADKVNDFDVLAHLYQDILNAVIPGPAVENGDLGWIHHTIDLIDKRHVDARQELDGRGDFRVAGATGDLEAVDSILMHGLQHNQSTLGGRC